MGRVQDESKSEFLATLMGSISPGKLAVRKTEMMPERKLGKLFTLSRKREIMCQKKLGKHLARHAVNRKSTRKE